MSEPTELTTFIIHDPKVQQGIISMRNISILTLIFSLVGIGILWGEFVSIFLYIFIAMSIVSLSMPYVVRCTIDATTKTLIVHQQRLWQHQTKTYPLTELHDTAVQGNSLVFIMESGKRIIIGPFTDVDATAHALWTFMDRTFPEEPPESTIDSFMESRRHEQNELTTFAIHDPTEKSTIRCARTVYILLICLALMGLFIFVNTLVIFLLCILLLINATLLGQAHAVTCTIDATTETLIVHQQRLWWYRTFSYPLTQLKYIQKDAYSLIFVLDSGRHISIGPLPNTARTAQELSEFLIWAFPDGLPRVSSETTPR